MMESAFCVARHPTECSPGEAVTIYMIIRECVSGTSNRRTSNDILSRGCVGQF